MALDKVFFCILLNVSHSSTVDFLPIFEKFFDSWPNFILKLIRLDLIQAFAEMASFRVSISFSIPRMEFLMPVYKDYLTFSNFF